MVFLQLKKWHYLLIIAIAITAILTIGRLVFFNRPVVKPVNIARLDLDKLVRQHPDWGKYNELQKEIAKLEQKWDLPDSAVKDQSFGTNQGLTQAVIQQQLGKVDQIFKTEASAKLEELNKSLQARLETRNKEMEVAFREKVDSLNKSLEQELNQKVQTQEKELVKYQQELEQSYKLTLTNLQLQLTTISNDQKPGSTTKDPQEIQVEIDKIRFEIEQKTEARKRVIENEFISYGKKRRAEVEREIQQFRNEQQIQLSKEMEEYKRQISDEFNQWYQERSKEMKQTNLSESEKIQSNYMIDRSRIMMLQAQQDQIKNEILWDYRQLVKRVAQHDGIDCVVKGEIANIKLLDITPRIRLEK